MRAANQRPIVALGVLAMLGVMSGCATTDRRQAKMSVWSPDQATANQPTTPAEREFPAEPAPTGAGRGTGHDGMLDFEHPQVQARVAEYQTSMRPYIERALERGSKYLPRMKKILGEEGVPPEFAYGVPIVESGYSLHAVSHAGAVGPWQFIRGTGQRYGLRIDGYVDERRDPEKATRAAARYLRYLYERFGDWHLSLAAYNTGEGNIQRIQDGRGCDNFWEMSERGYLPHETSNYVPKVLAAVEVMQSAAHYGFEIPTGDPTRFDVVEVTRPISLKAVAQLCGSDLDTVKELNPALRRGVVPPRGYTLRLPKGTAQRFEIAFASYHEPPPLAVRPSARGTHKVRRGETLSSIARRHGVTTSALMRANGLRRSNHVKAGQTLKIPAAPSRRSGVVAARAKPKPTRVGRSEQRGSTRVARSQRRFH